jgi:hypothetical protein
VATVPLMVCQVKTEVSYFGWSTQPFDGLESSSSLSLSLLFLFLLYPFCGYKYPDLQYMHCRLPRCSVFVLLDGKGWNEE